MEHFTMLKILNGHVGHINSLAITPDGKLIIAACRDERIKIWDFEKRRLIQTLTEHKKEVNSIAVSPNGKYFTSVDSEGIIKIWRVKEFSIMHSWKGHGNKITSVTFSPNGKYIATGSSGNFIRIWKSDSMELKVAIENPKGKITSLIFTPDGKYLISGDKNHNVKIWDFKKKECLKSLEGHNTRVSSVAITPDGLKIISSSYGRYIIKWDFITGKKLALVLGDAIANTSLNVSSDGKYVISGGVEDIVRIWEVGSMKLIKALESHPTAVNTAIFSPDGKYIITGSTRVIIWGEKEINEDLEKQKVEKEQYLKGERELDVFPGVQMWISLMQNNKPTNKLYFPANTTGTLMITDKRLVYEAEYSYKHESEIATPTTEFLPISIKMPLSVDKGKTSIDVEIPICKIVELKSVEKGVESGIYASKSEKFKKLDKGVVSLYCKAEGKFLEPDFFMDRYIAGDYLKQLIDDQPVIDEILKECVEKPLLEVKLGRLGNFSGKVWMHIQISRKKCDDLNLPMELNMKHYI